MGMLVNGIWHDVWYDTKDTKGQFVRAASQFRNFITEDGAPGPTGMGGFKAESGRYHLYVSYACPWAHRTLIFRKLKGLEDHISVSVVHPLMLERGWVFKAEEGGATVDHLFNSAALSDIYVKADPNYSGRVTVPVLWDKQSGTIVSNESAEIIRMFNTAFNGITGNTQDFYPEELRAEIDALNAFIYDNINNGVYKCGFATAQSAYEQNFDALFSALDTLEQRLEGKRYLFGAQLTEADLRLFTTLIRFDPVYVGHFKCNRQRIADYPNLSGYLSDLYATPRISDTVNFPHIKRHYYGSHKTINPNGIVPVGPELDFA
jgi:putative glutathione S-transferase